MRIRCALLVAALLVAPAGLSGQSVAIGAKAGMNFARLEVEDLDDVGTRKAFVGGVFLAFRVTGGFTFQPEVLVNYRGVAGGLGISRIETTYIELPVLFKFSLPIGGVLRPSVYAGSALALNISCTVNDGPDCDSAGPPQELKSADLGAILGGGFDVSVGSLLFTVEGRFTWGLTDLQVDAAARSLKSRTFAIIAGIGFRLL